MVSGPAGPTLTAGRHVVVEVPATIANLGAGFDCLGLAVDLALRVELEVVDGAAGKPVELTVEGEGDGDISTGRGNRFLEALDAGLREHRVDRPAGLGWRIRMRNEIPLARGLGSSGAAAVAGLLAADALAGAATAEVPMLDRATALEGHSDNVAPALLGGFVASLPPRAIRFDAPDSLRVVLLVPEMRLSTPRMRAILPESVPRTDAIANLGRVALGVAGIATGDMTVLARLTEDRLHEPYRTAAYPQLPALVAAARSAGAIGACLAGGGSTVAAFTIDSTDTRRIGDAMRAAATELGLPASIRVVSPRNRGARVVEPA